MGQIHSLLQSLSSELAGCYSISGSEAYYI